MHDPESSLAWEQGGVEAERGAGAQTHWGAGCEEATQAGRVSKRPLFLL